MRASSSALLFILSLLLCPFSSLFFFNDTATTEIYTLSLHDALPISVWSPDGRALLFMRDSPAGSDLFTVTLAEDRKSTRLNSSHSQISYAVFCLKKKKKTKAIKSFPRNISANAAAHVSRAQEQAINT